MEDKVYKNYDMERLDQVEDELLDIFQKINVVHEILAFEVDFQCEFSKGYLRHYKFDVPFPGLEVYTFRNTANVLQEILSKRFVCTLSIHEPDHQVYKPKPASIELIMNLKDAFKTNNTVKKLHMDTRIGAQGAIEFAEALKMNTTIQELNLRHNNIGNNGCIALADSLKINKTLKKINLVSNYIGNEGCIALANALKINKTIKIVYFRGNKIGLEGCVELAKALKINKTIQEINLCHNKIGSNGCKILADSLKINKTIKILDLGVNEIGDEGADALANVLKINTTIQNMFLGRNYINAKGAIAIANALKINSGIQKIDLSENFKIGDDGGFVLLEALKLNTTIKKIDLTRCNISRAILQQMKTCNVEVFDSQNRPTNGFMNDKDEFEPTQ